ncbi:jg11711 [Pararge aegeria aegeria]|uniref:Jg11711 protein n=1 Tax=Pararge aegeria aegeria TaxID=348720 RepID=A0A8S4S201_9NEOP|nr:jg11711 [Pararge aegeria aegeria]
MGSGCYGVTQGVGRARKLAMRRAPGLDDIGGRVGDVDPRVPPARKPTHSLSLCLFLFPSPGALNVAFITMKVPLNVQRNLVGSHIRSFTSKVKRDAEVVAFYR